MLPVNDKEFCIRCNNTQISERNSIILDIAHTYSIRFIDLYKIFQIKGVLPETMTHDGIHITSEAYKYLYNLL